MKVLLHLLIITLLSSFVTAAWAQPEPRASLRSSAALWVVRDALLSPEKITQVVADAHRAGITDLLVQVRGRGDAYYDSDIVPMAAPLRDAHRKYGEYDPLELMIEEAQTHGIRVHAWINIYLVAAEWPDDPEHVIRMHPEWSAVDSRQRPFTQIGTKALAAEFTEGIYLAPGNSGVVSYYVDVVQELVKDYAVDGIHLDYVRYPYMDSGYTSRMRRAFRADHGIDPLELAWNREGLKEERGKDGVAALDAAWNQFRADRITTLVYQVRKTLRMTRPGVVLSAAVKPDPDEALTRYGQDWVKWVNTGLVDVVAPMMYSKSTKRVRAQVERTLEQVPADRIWAGIAVYNQSLASAEAKIRAIQSTGVQGISIFSYNSIPRGGSGLVQLLSVR